MTRNDLADDMVSKTRLTKSQALEAIEALVHSATRAFLHGESIYIRGFGTFRIVTRATKKARNISKGTFVTVPERHAVKFIPCNDLKELIK